MNVLSLTSPELESANCLVRVTHCESTLIFIQINFTAINENYLKARHFGDVLPKYPEIVFNLSEAKVTVYRRG